MKFFRKSGMTLYALATASFSVLALQSCVNDAYDLNKGIDTSVNIDGNISVPIGSTGKIMIGDFLEIDGSSGLSEAANGDYSIQFAGSPVSQTVTVPEIVLPADDFLADFEIQPVNIKEDVEKAIDDFGEFQDFIDNYPLTGMAPVVIDNLLDGSLTSADIEINQKVDDLASTVSEIGSVYLDAPISMDFSFISANGAGAITVKKGLTVTFPDFIAIDAVPDGFTLDESNVLTLVNDVRLTSGSPFKIGFSISEMDLEALKTQSGGKEGYIEENGSRYIRIQQSVEIGGLVLEVLPEDFGKTLGEVPSTIDFDINVTADKLTVTGATLVLDPDITIEDQTVELGEMPEFLTGDNLHLDIYNPVIMLNVSNSTPIAVTVSAKIQGYDEQGNPTMDAPIEIGSASDPIIIRNLPGGQTCSTTVCISRRPVEQDETAPYDQYYQNVVISNLSDIVAKLPHTIRILDLSVAPYVADGEKYTSIMFGGSGAEEYEFSFDYSIDVPLSFGEDLSIEYPYDITGLNSSLNSGSEDGNMSVYADDARINLTFVNTLPLGMSVTALPLDTDGNVMGSSAGIEVGIAAADGSEARVAPGTLEKPSSNPVVISLRAAKDAIRNLDGFRLNINGSSSAETAGTALNANQYIQITDISLDFDGGVEMEF